MSIPIRLRILTWTPHFFYDTYDNTTRHFRWMDRDVIAHFTNDKNNWQDADAIWFHAPTFTRLPSYKPNNQRWVVMSMESEVNYPCLKSRRWMKKFDLRMTYQLDSDVPVPYITKDFGELRTTAPLLETKSENSPLLYLNSNPVRFRDRYMRKLMKHIAVDSYGRCLKNKSDPLLKAGSNASGKYEILKRYRFIFTAENSIAKDYVTDKLYHPLVVGTVPVYWGAPNVDQFLPNKNCLINVLDFRNPEELADYLNYLCENDLEYSKYLQWKTKEFSPSFKTLMRINQVHSQIRLCIKLLHRCGQSCNCGKFPEIGGYQPQASSDQSQATGGLER